MTMDIETWDITRPIPYARNPRDIPDAAIAKVAGSLTEFGWRQPIVVDRNGVIVVGHTRLLAAQRLGMTQVPVHVAKDLTPAQAKAYRLTDNRVSEETSWNNEMLAIELEDMSSLDVDLGTLGFDTDELATLLADATDAGAGGLTDPDAVPQPEQLPVSQTGDVWIMGRHRLMVGDSTNASDVAKLMQGKHADLCFTSPPYAQQRDYKSGISDWDGLMEGVFSALPVKPDAQVLVNLGLVHRDGEWLPYWDGWVEWMRSQGWRRFGWYVWDQGPGMPGDWNGRLAPSHEFIFHFNRIAERARKTKAKKPEFIRQRTDRTMREKDGTLKKFTNEAAGLQPNKIADSVIRVMRHKARGIECQHPAVFPVDLVSEMLTAFSDPDDIVFEPFCGSGTQIISAQKNGRSCMAMEIAGIYADVAIRRWQSFTGQRAVLEGSDLTFEEVQDQRIGDVPNPLENYDDTPAAAQG